MESYKENFLRNDEIGVWIENYNNIFSDFDQRPLSQRGLSEDFLSEVKKACKVKNYNMLGLKIAVPKKVRDYTEESIIKRRLREYFKKHSVEFEKEYKKLIYQGFFFVSLGIIFMALTTFFIFRDAHTGYILTFLAVLLEPAGWFLFWEGLNLLIFKSKEKKPNIKFYKKMSTSIISFVEY